MSVDDIKEKVRNKNYRNKSITSDSHVNVVKQSIYFIENTEKELYW
jgi:hypothetical protein